MSTHNKHKPTNISHHNKQETNYTITDNIISNNNDKPTTA